MLTFLLRSYKHCKKFQEKSRDHILMSSSDPIYQGVSLKKVSNWHHVKTFANSMYKRVIVSRVCADVSDFEHRGVKMFLLKIWSEYQNLVRKFQAFLKIQTISKLNFHKVEYTRWTIFLRKIKTYVFGVGGGWAKWAWIFFTSTIFP